MTCERCRRHTRSRNEAAEEQVRRRQEAHEASLTMGRVVTGPKGRETSEETKKIWQPHPNEPRVKS